MTVVKIKKKKTQESVPLQENLNLKIINSLEANQIENETNYQE